MPKTYVGKGRVVGQYGNIAIGLKAEDLRAHENERGYINLVVGMRKEPDKYGNTHTVWVDDYKKEQF